VIEFLLDRPSRVNLDIFDVRGRKVKTVLSQRLRSGLISVQWKGDDASGRSVASGIYFCRIKAGDFTESKKLLLLK
jgi:flagellar hook assembly protein FlgD